MDIPAGQKVYIQTCYRVMGDDAKDHTFDIDFFPDTNPQWYVNATRKQQFLHNMVTMPTHADQLRVFDDVGKITSPTNRSVVDWIDVYCVD